MVVCLKQETMRFLADKPAAPRPLTVWDETELALDADDLASITPLLAKAKQVLLGRLKVIDEETFYVDDIKLAFAELVALVNGIVRQTGGQYLGYPGQYPLLHRDGLGMTIHQPTNS